jgi:2-iminobutanoate/2-iminopropanoate deaminase
VPRANRTRGNMFRGFEMQRKTVQILGFILAAALALCAHGQEHKPVNVGTAHGLPFSDGMLAGNTLYIAGQGGDDESGQLVPGGIVAETKVTLANVKKVVKAAGLEMKDIVSVTVYLADFREFPAMNEVYKEVMPDPKPVRTTIQVAGLMNNARIEITAIAVKRR